MNTAVIKRIFFVIGSLLFLGSFASANNNGTVVLGQPSFILAIEQDSGYPLSAIPVLVQPHTKQPTQDSKNESGPNISSSFESIRGSGSSLTIKEMSIVMSGGRNYDPLTKKWGYREPFAGEKRNTFMLSWEAKRVKYGASGLPDGLKYSTK